MSDENISYRVRTKAFEGPLEVLLSLIESRKLFINEIALSQVTEDYIAYTKSLQNLPQEKHIADVSYFILIASTLLLIKSKSLLPNLALTEDETEKIDDLERRLKLYQIIKTASVDIKNNFGLNIIFTPMDRSYNEPIFSPDSKINRENMSLFVKNVINEIPKPKEHLPEVEVKKMINIEQVIDNLTNRIQNAMNLSFKDFSKSHGAENQKEAKVHIIVSFLAMLELVREGIIDVIQNNTFEDISINRQLQTENNG